MRAFWMNPSEVPCSDAELGAEGIHAQAFDPANPTAAAAAAAGPRGFGAEETVELTAANVRDEAHIAKEIDEHAHMVDEVRLVLDGGAIYDIRARDERWLRVWLGRGDLIIVPAKRYHRFLLGTEQRVRYVQPYDDRGGLLPLYRVSNDATRAV